MPVLGIILSGVARIGDRAECYSDWALLARLPAGALGLVSAEFSQRSTR